MLKRVIISGGGTGGHIFPAISIANEIKARNPQAEILFVGAKGGMEMTLVPKSNYEIKGVWISGIMRSFSPKNILKNLVFPYKLIVSLLQARKIVKNFNAEAVVGVGGYASGPVGRVASGRGIPLFLQEQNAYPGITNKWLAKRATRILLGNEAAMKYFEKSKCKVTGNPIRQSLLDGNREAALKKLGFDPERPVLLSVGGSLGAGSLNAAWEAGVQKLLDAGIQVMWQCGKRYHEALRQRVPEHKDLRLMAFIEDMGAAYAAADLVVTRAGASTLSELILLNKPSIMVPSPNVSEDHQTKNARSLTDRDAAVLVKDVEAKEKLVDVALAILTNPDRLNALREGISKIEKHDAAKEIVDEIEKNVKNKTSN